MLELQQHPAATAATLTYDDEHLPPTLRKKDLSAFLKRLRAHATRKLMGRRLRHFACGEYGEKNGRPHYHAILYGIHHEQQRAIVEAAWQAGRVQTRDVTPEAVAYIAGYVAKKYRHPYDKTRERIDAETGELYKWQPPFLEMSRRPGIASEARKHVHSWRSYAIQPGTDTKQPVPRYLHEAWLAIATLEQVEALKEERKKREKPLTEYTLNAQEKIAESKHQLSKNNRSL